ncbi:MAG TPA: hypothetical protein ENK67_04520 [Flavobacteriia bacterium]|nr:hypothetical protein [Flavobacteriia bacterium]
MKKTILYFLFLFILTANAQNIIDNNTEDIQNYFYQGQVEINKTEVNTTSEVTILQQGENNDIEILSSGKKIQLVKQVGDDNNYQYFTFYDSNKANLNINQFGDDNDIQIYGHNSIVEKLKITQSTNNQSILIFNF